MAKVKNRLARIAGDYDSTWDPYADPLTSVTDSVAPSDSTQWYETSTPGVYSQTASDGTVITYDINTGVYEDSTGAIWSDNTGSGTKTTTTTTGSNNTVNTITKAGQSLLNILSAVFGGGTTSKATTTTGTVLNTSGTTTTNIPLIIGVGVLAAIFITKQMDK